MTFDPLLKLLGEASALFRRNARLRREEGEPVLASYLDRRRRSLDEIRKDLKRKRLRDSVPRPDT